MKVENMTSPNGNKVANQFILRGIKHQSSVYPDDETTVECFQSYDSIIVKRSFHVNKWMIELDRDTWDYSVTTGKYRNQFLGESKKETQAKIDNGEYTLTDLNA